MGIKRRHPPDPSSDVLEEADLFRGSGPNALILPASKAARIELCKASTEEDSHDLSSKKATPKKPLSKRAKRKIEQLSRKKEREGKLESILDELQKHRISEDIRGKLKSSGELVHPSRQRAPLRKNSSDAVEEYSDEDDEGAVIRPPSQQGTEDGHQNPASIIIDRGNSDLMTPDPPIDKSYDESSLTKRRDDRDDSEEDERIEAQIEGRRDDGGSLKRECVERELEISKLRSMLPACLMEQEIVDAIYRNDVCLVTGDTGCGKSTQVPQFLYEFGFTTYNPPVPSPCGDTSDSTSSASNNHLLSQAASPLALSQSRCSNSKEVKPSPCAQSKHSMNNSINSDAAISDDITSVSEEINEQHHQVPTASPSSTTTPISSSYLIGITQPRRVAVTSVSRRVGEELGDPDLVGYQIRYDKSNCSERCRLKFMTDGILLKEIQSDFLCSRYSVLILDEAHERSVNCDVLIGLLSRAVILRRRQFDEGGQLPPLRLVVMSATLRVTDFTENRSLFPRQPPIVNIDARTHPVTVHFSRVTPNNYLEETVKKIKLLHKKLPAGSVLVFVTGKREVLDVCRKINDRKPAHRDALDDALGTGSGPAGTDCEAAEVEEVSGLGLVGGVDDEYDDGEVGYDLEAADVEPPSPSSATDAISDDIVESGLVGSGVDEVDRPTGNGDLDGGTDSQEVAAVGDRNVVSKGGKGRPNNGEESAGADTFELDGFDDERGNTLIKGGDVVDEAAALGFDSGLTMGTVNPKAKLSVGSWRGSDGSGDLRAIPLYALLSKEEQEKAFEEPKDGERLVIISTNVAETSVTLPNIRYVIDSGKEKRRVFDRHNDATSSFSIHWIAKSSANQRAGRAGRVGPGHCYRLYSSAVYNDTLKEFPPVNLLSTPLDSILLYLASLGIPDVKKFPFPTPPFPSAVKQAEDVLLALGSLTFSSSSPSRPPTLGITPIGRLVARFPLPPRLASTVISAVARRLEGEDSNNRVLIQSVCLIASCLSAGNIVDYSDRPNDFKDLTPNQLRWATWRERCFSDMEGYLYVALTYGRLARLTDYGDKPSSFCRIAGVNKKQMTEVLNQYTQLIACIGRVFPRLSKLSVAASSSNLNKETSEMSSLFEDKSFRLAMKKENVLAVHRCLLSGFIDRIAGRWDIVTSAALTDPADEVKGGYILGGRGITESKAYIHAQSTMRKLRPRPALIAFGHVMSQVVPVKTSSVGNEGVPQTTVRRYMKDCFSIDPLDLANVHSPLIADTAEFLTVPAPYYDEKRKDVLGYTAPVYSPLELQLPHVCRVVKDEKIRSKVMRQYQAKKGR